MCSRNTDTPSGNAEGRLSHDGSNSGKKNKNKPKNPIAVSNANTVTKVFCFSRPHAPKETTKKYFRPSESVHCSLGKTAWVCVKFKFLMTALGKSKENNEIKPLPPDLGWDVTACLFSPAPVFSRLSNLLCSCGSMIHREEKKKRREQGKKKKKQQLFFASLFHLWLQALGVFARSKTSLRAKGHVFQEVKRLFPLPQAR